MKTALLLLFTLLLPVVDAHTRLECPPPRSGETGEKMGPCDAPDDLSLEAYPLTAGALNTITWLESIPHPGAPARFALSRDGDDSVASFESCLLLDHVPHDVYSVPDFTNEATWHRSSITLWIPDVYCERCHLQLMTVMSDEAHGVPVNTTCAYGGALAENKTKDATLPACPAVYHSCSPVSINGTTPRNEMDQCNTADFEAELEWPLAPSTPTFDDAMDSMDVYAYSTYYYKGDPGIYNRSDSRLMAAGAPIQNCDNLGFCDPSLYFEEIISVPVDAKYTQLQGSCAAMVTLQVEAFEIGVLPNTPKNMSAAANPPPGACSTCEPLGQCFLEGCILRDPVTGNWTGQAAPCNEFGPPCEVCFPDSPCYRGEGSDVTMGEEDDAPPTTTGGDEQTTTDNSSSSSSGGGIRSMVLVACNALLLCGLVAMSIMAS